MPSISNYSAYDLEIVLREEYENVYAIECYIGHAYWKKNLLNKIPWNNFINPKANDSWSNLIFSILEIKIMDYSYNLVIFIYLYNVDNDSLTQKKKNIPLSEKLDLNISEEKLK